MMRPTMARCTSPAIKKMNRLLWERFVVARFNLQMAWLVSDYVDETRAACRTALNTWYAFATQYNQFRTDKESYWPTDE
jgi:hypothetical protein